MQIKPFLTPLVSLVIAILLGIVIFMFMLNRINPINAQIGDLNSQQQDLEAKLTSLQKLFNSVNTQSQLTTIALPSTNIAGVVLAELKTSAVENNLVLTNVNVSSTEATDSDLDYSTIELKANGGYTDIEAFIKSIQQLLPLVNISAFKIDNSAEGGLVASLSLYTYWSEYPQTLPSVNQPINNLTDDEVNLINKLSDFTKPALGQLVPESTNSGRINPFSLGQ